MLDRLSLTARGLWRVVKRTPSDALDVGNITGPDLLPAVPSLQPAVALMLGLVLAAVGDAALRPAR